MRGKMREIVIFKDHTHFDREWKSDERRPSIDGLPLSRFADLFLRWRKYSGYLLRTQKILMRTSTDNDGLPIEHFYDISFNATNECAASANTSISITFNDTYDGDHDYVAMVHRGGRPTTAYKWGSKGTPTETRFKIYRAVIRRKEGDAEAWFKDELTRLEKLLDGLDQGTLTLRSWADSGLSMKVFCTAYSHSSVISPDQLLLHSSKELSLDDFKRKLRCKVCGARCSNISVP